MRWQRTVVGLVASALLMVTTGAMAQQVSPQEFRARLTAWATASTAVAGPAARDLVERINALSDEQLAEWLSLIDDPDAFLKSLEKVTRRLEEHGVKSQSTEPRQFTPLTPGMESPTGLAPSISAATVASFPPDYPPDSGAYKDNILDTITGFGITASNTNRCDATEWGEYVGVWWPLNTAFDAVDGACVVAGCDPTGVVCAVLCTVLEVAKAALKIAAMPLEACNVHQSAIDGAEVEAAYENSIQILELLDAHDTAIQSALSTHDREIKQLLAALQQGIDANNAKLDLVLARQLEVIRLLITPEGRRATSVPACDDPPCKWNP